MATVISGQKDKYLKLCNSIFHRTMLHPKFIPAIHYQYSKTTVHGKTIYSTMHFQPKSPIPQLFMVNSHEMAATSDSNIQTVRKCSYVAMLIPSLHVCMYILSATYSQGSDFSKLVDCTMPLMSPITINGHLTHESVTSLRNKLK